RGSSHSERSSLYIRSVLMLPDPTIATLALDGMNAPLLVLFKRQPHGPESVELRDKIVTRADVDRSGTRSRQDHVTLAQPHAEAFYLARQPRDRGHGIS